MLYLVWIYFGSLSPLRSFPVNRRDFLRTGTVAAAAAATGPMLLGTEDKAGTKTPRVGSGDYVYECNHAWGTLPDGYSWQTTHNVAVDEAGLVYVTHQGIGKLMDTVLVFDGTGKFVRSFGKAWHGGGHGIDIRKEGSEEFLYLTNTWKNPKVVKATLKGETVWSLNRPKIKEYDDPKAAYNPTNIAFTPDGGFWIGDGYGSHYLLKYASGQPGEPTMVIGGKGAAEGQFATPHGNWTDLRTPNHPKLVVCDRANGRLQTFTPEGKHLNTSSKGTVLFPAHIDIQGKLMLVADLHARLTLLDTDGKVLAHLGDDAEWRKTVLDGFKVRKDAKLWQPGKFVHPHDACFDAKGNIFVAEWVEPGRVSYLTKVS